MESSQVCPVWQTRKQAILPMPLERVLLLCMVMTIRPQQRILHMHTTTAVTSQASVRSTARLPC